jgi:hypothetical protein
VADVGTRKRRGLRSALVGLGLLRRRCPELHLPDEAARVRGILYLDLDFSQGEEVAFLSGS